MQPLRKAHPSTRRVPFGAAHRLNLDTPPLKGYCRGTLVPRCELDRIHTTLRDFAFLTRNRSFGGIWRTQNQVIEQKSSSTAAGTMVARSAASGQSSRRTRNRRILAAAEADGKAPSEWARDLLLARRGWPLIRGEMEMHIFTELVGLQMLLMSTLDPLLRGETDDTGPGAQISSARSRQPRLREPRNSWPSAAKRRRQCTMADCSTLGTKRVNYLATARLHLHARRVLLRGSLPRLLLMYIRFNTGFRRSSSTTCRTTCALRSAGTAPVPISQYQLLYIVGPPNRCDG